MAAVLCSGLGNACKGCSDCCGELCLLPFKACGSCCDGLSQCCRESCKYAANCCTSSFCCYITLACVLNIPPIVLGLMDLVSNGFSAGCLGSIWLIVFWLFCVVHIVAAFYMAYAVDNSDNLLPKRDGDGEVDTNDAFGRMQDGSDRMKNLFCYDHWMAGYILVVLAYFAWLFWGAVLWATLGDNEQCDGIGTTLGISYGFGWAFVYMGGFGLCCSFCCGVFVGKSRQDEKNQALMGSQYNPQMEAPKKNDIEQQATTKMEEAEVEEIPSKKEDPNVPVATAVAY